MPRALGPLLLVALLAIVALLRAAESSRADTLLENQARARSTLAELHAACEELAVGGARPGLALDAAAAVPGLERLDRSQPELAFCSDGDYLYGLSSETRLEEGSGRQLQGWVLRAWPARFGVTGNREYQLSDDGILWEGQNRNARSGTERGFPPPFPDPDIGQPRPAWWQVQLPPAHR